jgi:hypothetical protein
MKPIRRLLLAVVIPSVLMGTILGGALGAPAFADTGARSLQLTAVKPQFTSFTCLKGSSASCLLARVTVDSKASSNLSNGAGSYHADLIVDFSPGGTCNIVTEDAAFAFDNGTVSVHSYHEDCATAGLRIDTSFEVTAATGDFQGATGGREFSSVGNAAPVIYQGSISS